MRLNYSKSAHPPCLMVPVVVAGPALPLVLDVDAILDTGADGSVIPVAMRKALRLDPIGVITVRGARNEHWEEVPLYQIRLRVAGADWIESLAVEAEKSYATIGRDVLEHFLLTAHGPEQWFELSLPAKP